MSDTETVRCPCGRLHQIPKAIDPSSELARVTAQNGAYRKQIDRQVEEVKRLTAVSKTLQTMNADGKAEVERLKAALVNRTADRDLWLERAKEHRAGVDAARAVLASSKERMARQAELEAEVERLRFEAEKRGCYECPSKEARIEAALALHYRSAGGNWCEVCVEDYETGQHEDWPCPTVKALTGGREK